MKEISINEIQVEVAAWIRQTLLDEEIVITEHGQPLATLVPFHPKRTGKPLPNRAAWIQSLPLVADSTEYVSEMREERAGEIPRC
jgi:antitoxin (DNA-binding transcriptional repressor) of toxin-antitoxin stability system